jgi:hypothetical protein
MINVSDIQYIIFLLIIIIKLKDMQNNMFEIQRVDFIFVDFFSLTSHNLMRKKLKRE